MKKQKTNEYELKKKYRSLDRKEEDEYDIKRFGRRVNFATMIHKFKIEILEKQQNNTMERLRFAMSVKKR